MFQYGIDFVVQQDLPGIRKYSAARGYSIDCPFCGGHRKMNINPDKGVYSCPRCGRSGGFLKLHMELARLSDTKSAKHDLDQRYGVMDEPSRKAVSVQAARASHYVPENKAARIEKRDAIYRKWLELLPLNEDHLAEIHSERRGWMDDEFIDHMGYKSYAEGNIQCNGINYTLPEYAYLSAAHVMNMAPDQYFSRFDHSDIPGFMLTRNNHLLSQREENCLLIPVRNRAGRISFLQQKYPKLPENATQQEKDSFKKYGRYGSYGETGCSTSGIESIHYTGFDFARNCISTPKNVCLTEGVLKADIASYLSGKPFIALVGVSVYSQLDNELSFLKSHGTENIFVCTDMDYMTNENVKRAMETIIEKIRKTGLRAVFCSWDPEEKGIDDVLIAKRKGKNIHFEYR